jgi:hypothetical protein
MSVHFDLPPSITSSLICIIPSSPNQLATRFIIGVSIALPATLFVINHRLYKIATRSVTYMTAAEKRRDVYFDLAIGLGIPIIHMAMRASSLVAFHLLF